ncbi:AAA domain-containing protein [Mesorhizobium sp. M7A.F.Ca.MR.362.00.0.0]|uniref:AAA domain-containing protein n=1 Tax=Mesorhizobium sp. M7A.F.Ca.MR.362.00.0.0 TaxID=2496779 RepID=UPI000FD30F3C|nr:AAA domain-containing protein [Mesorhizobium sp. M7A.F.Ca.MR.362.00.0.0]RUU81265.1 ATPase [Mesorhizobium sp. M7A.F.Ca.MR.362.00.0.0]RWN94826.1 MAG: ATPase [Mesorhizobium sp.]
MKIEFLSPKGPQPTEQFGLSELRLKLPAAWKGYANLYIRNERRRGQDREVDAVLITPDRLILVDLKHGRGKFESRSGIWYVDDEAIGQSAAVKIRENAKVLAEIIRKNVAQIPGAPPVESVVVFTNPGASFSGLEPFEKDRCFSIGDFVRIGNETIFKQYFTMKSNFSESDPLNAGAYYSALQKFFTNDRHVGARKAKYHGFVPTGTAEFEHPLFKEFSAIDDANPNYTGLLRIWDFASDAETFALEDERRPVAERERTALGHIRANDPGYFDNFVLRSLRHDREYGLNFSEIFERHSDLVRLTRYIGSIADLTTERRIEFARLFLDRVAALHRMKLAHRDLDRHSIWINERRSSVVLSGFGAAHFPEVDSIGEKRSKLLAGGYRVPEDVGAGERGTPFQQDVFLAAAAVFTILTGEKLPLLDEIPYWQPESLSNPDIKMFQPWFERSMSWEAQNRFRDGVEASNQFVDALMRSEGFNVERQLVKFRRDIDPIVDYGADAEIWFKRKPYRVFKAGGLLIKSWPAQYVGDHKSAAIGLLAFFARAARVESLAAGWTPRLRLACLSMDGVLVVQDWADGRSLQETDVAIWSEEQIRSFLISLLVALEEMHASGLAHGDLKPSNVVVSESDDAAFRATIVDLLDYTRAKDGVKLSAAYCPPHDNGDLIVRDRYAVGKIVKDSLLAWTGSRPDDGPLYARVAEAWKVCDDESDYWTSIRPLLAALQETSKALSEEPIFLSAEFRQASFEGTLLPENEQFRVVWRKDRSQIEIFGFDQKLTIVVDPSDQKPTKASVFSVDSRESDWAAQNHILTFVGEVRVGKSAVTRFSGFELLMGRLASASEPSLEFEDNRLVDDQSKAVVSATHMPHSAPRFPVVRFWQETITVEEEVLPEIRLTDSPKETGDPGTVILTCAEPPLLDTIDAKEGQFPTVTWNGDRVGELDNERSGRGKIVLRNAKFYRRLRAGDILRIQSQESHSSFRRRSKAVDRILHDQGQIPNLISYFDPLAKIEPQILGEEIPAGALGRYKLNAQQEEAFEHLWRYGPVGLLQGPPGTGKTYFTSAFVHWALNEGGMRNVLVLSQSHEAVNTVAERVLKTFAIHGGGVDLLRVGQYDKISPSLRTYHSQAVQDRYRELFRADVKERIAIAGRRIGLNKNYVREAFEVEATFGAVAHGVQQASSDLESEDADVETAARRRLITLQRTFEKMLVEDIVQRDGSFHEVLEELRDEVSKRHHVFDPDARDRFLRLVSLSRDWIASLATRGRNLEEFLARSRNLVCGTCVGVGRHGLGIEKGVFDLVIIDEAARCTPGELAVGMQSGKRVLLVGDHRQLPPLFGHDALKALHLRLPGFAIEDLKRSDFERAFGSSYGQSVARTLKTQYRMGSEISGLVSETFYPGLEIETDRDEPSEIYKELKQPFDRQVVWMDIGRSGDAEAGTSYTNRAEGVAILNLLRQIGSAPGFLDRAAVELNLKGDALVGVICTYAQQAELIQNMITTSDLSAAMRQMVKVDTVDAYQGKENRIVIISLVRSNVENEMGHVRSKNRINVALSRAMDRLIIVGSANMFGASRNPLKPILRKLQATDRVRNAAGGIQKRHEQRRN